MAYSDISNFEKMRKEAKFIKYKEKFDTIFFDVPYEKINEIIKSFGFLELCEYEFRGPVFKIEDYNALFDCPELLEFKFEIEKDIIF